MRSPIGILGGKGNMVSKLFKLVPSEYKFYAEPFFGGGSLFFRLPPADIETINDINGNVMDFYKILQSEEGFERFIKLSLVTPYSREQYNSFRKLWKSEEDPVLKAWRWWVIAKQSFAGDHSWGTAITLSRRGMAATTSKFLSAIDSLPLVHERLKRCQIENVDALTIIKRYGVKDSFVYCDPPYMSSTRKSGKYDFEMTDLDHAELLEMCLESPAKIMISGYPTELYSKMLSDWDCVKFETASWAARKTRGSGNQGKGSSKKLHPRTECVWRNYARKRIVKTPVPKKIKRFPVPKKISCLKK